MGIIIIYLFFHLVSVAAIWFYYINIHVVYIYWKRNAFMFILHNSYSICLQVLRLHQHFLYRIRTFLFEANFLSLIFPPFFLFFLTLHRSMKLLRPSTSWRPRESSCWVLPEILRALSTTGCSPSAETSRLVHLSRDSLLGEPGDLIVADFLLQSLSSLRANL